MRPGHVRDEAPWLAGQPLRVHIGDCSLSEAGDFGIAVLVAAGGFLLALASTKLTTWLPVPPPAVFLLLAAAVSDVFPRISDEVSIQHVERIGVVALVVILFDGGMHVGWRRMRGSAVPVLSLGVLG